MSMHQNIAMHTSSSFSSLIATPKQPQRHPASLLPMSCHDPRLLSIVAKPISRELVKWVARMFTAHINVDENFPESILPTPPPTPDKPVVNHVSDDTSTPVLPSLEDFITPLVEKSRAHVATLLSTLIYLERLCTTLPKHKGIPSSRHRIFLATFIIAAKYLNDCSPTNRNWSDFTQWFPISEINAMELELLRLLDYRLRFTEQEACRHLALFLSSMTVRQPSIFKFDSSAPRGGVGKDMLTPSSSANELPHLTTRTCPHEYPLLTHRRSPHKFSMPLLMAAKNNRSSTSPRHNHCPQQERKIFSSSTPEAVPLVAYSDSNLCGNVLVPQINVERSRGFSNLNEMVSKVPPVTFPSPSQMLSQLEAAPFHTTPLEANLTTSGIHILNPPCLEFPRQPSIAHLSDSESLPLYLSNRNSLSEFDNHIHPGGDSPAIRHSSSVARNPFDSLFRKLWGRHGADSPVSTTSINHGRQPRLQQYGVFHEEIPYHISRPPLREFLRSVANADPVYESMAIC